MPTTQPHRNHTGSPHVHPPLCTIYAAGTYWGNEPDISTLPPDCLVVAADGGLDHARSLGIAPDVFIGDCDSVSTRPSSCHQTDDDPHADPTVITLPAEHDDPDMLSALKVGWSRGARRFHIYGGLGGRTDHTVANIQLMAMLASHGGVGFLHGKSDVTTAVCDGSLTWAASPHEHGEMVSVFAQSDHAEAVTISGFKYELRDATMTNTTVQGVSNEFVDGQPARVHVGKGTLIVTFAAGSPLPSLTTARPTSRSLGPLATELSKALTRPHRRTTPTTLIHRI